MEVSLSGDELYDSWIVLRRTAHILLKARQRELRQFGISPAEAAVLLLVHHKKNNVKPIEVSRFLLQEPHAISSLLARMEDHGLVRRIKDLDRKNLVRIVLTDKGEEIHYQSTKHRESVCTVMSALSEQERSQLLSYLQRLGGVALEESRKRHPSARSELTP